MNHVGVTFHPDPPMAHHDSPRAQLNGWGRWAPPERRAALAATIDALLHIQGNPTDPVSYKTNRLKF